jgi:hypothetical protein
MKDRDTRSTFPHEGLAVSLSLMYGGYDVSDWILRW